MSVSVGRQIKLTTEVARLTEEAPAKTTLEWSSSDESIAKINSQGIVTGTAPGYAMICCSAKDNPELKAYATIKVIQPVKAVKAEEAKITLLLGASEKAAQGKIRALITPENATTKKCIYTSSNESVVTVDAAGNLQAHAPGKARITVKLPVFPYIPAETY